MASEKGLVSLSSCGKPGILRGLLRNCRLQSQKNGLKKRFGRRAATAKPCGFRHHFPVPFNVNSRFCCCQPNNAIKLKNRLSMRLKYLSDCTLLEPDATDFGVLFGPLKLSPQKFICVNNSLDLYLGSTCCLSLYL
jgi:hypothetical protein